MTCFLSKLMVRNWHGLNWQKIWAISVCNQISQWMDQIGAKLDQLTCIHSAGLCPFLPLAGKANTSLLPLLEKMGTMSTSFKTFPFTVTMCLSPMIGATVSTPVANILSLLSFAMSSSALHQFNLFGSSLPLPVPFSIESSIKELIPLTLAIGLGIKWAPCHLLSIALS